MKGLRSFSMFLPTMCSVLLIIGLASTVVSNADILSAIAPVQAAYISANSSDLYSYHVDVSSIDGSRYYTLKSNGINPFDSPPISGYNGGASDVLIMKLYANDSLAWYTYVGTNGADTPISGILIDQVNPDILYYYTNSPQTRLTTFNAKNGTVISTVCCFTGGNARGGSFGSIITQNPDVEGELYIVVQDGAFSNKLSLFAYKKETGTFQPEGNRGFTSATSLPISICFRKAKGYIVISFLESSSNKMSVVRHTPSTNNFLAMGAYNFASLSTVTGGHWLDCDSTACYVLYSDSSASGKLSLMQYTEETASWARILSTGFTSENVVVTLNQKLNRLVYLYVDSGNIRSIDLSRKKSNIVYWDPSSFWTNDWATVPTPNLNSYFYSRVAYARISPVCKWGDYAEDEQRLYCIGQSVNPSARGSRNEIGTQYSTDFVPSTTVVALTTLSLKVRFYDVQSISNLDSTSSSMNIGNLYIGFKATMLYNSNLGRKTTLNFRYVSQVSTRRYPGDVTVYVFSKPYNGDPTLLSEQTDGLVTQSTPVDYFSFVFDPTVAFYSGMTYYFYFSLHPSLSAYRSRVLSDQFFQWSESSMSYVPSSNGFGYSLDTDQTPTMTTSLITSASLTSAEITSAQMTTSEMTTSEFTTAPMTTAEFTKMTSAQITTAGLTTSIQNAGANGDPMIYGFHDSKFWFNGYVGGIFNLYNDEYVNVNSLFAQANEKNGTVMEMIAVETAGHRISFNINDHHDNESMNVMLNGKNTTVKKSYISHLEGCVELGMRPKFLSIRTPLHDIKIKLGCPTGDGYITVHHLDFDINPPKNNEHKVGGVVGQTGNGKSDREDSHFEVSEIYGTEKSQFYKNAKFNC